MTGLLKSMLLRLIIVLVIPVVAVTLLTAMPVEAGWPGSSFRLTVDVSPAEGGGMLVESLLPDKFPMSYSYPADYSVVLKAIPVPGYRFSHWSGDASGNNNTVELTMSCSKSVTAVFTLITYPLKIQAIPYNGGEVTVEPQSDTGEGYTTGTQVTLNANAAEGYRFSHWSGNVSGQENPVTLDMNAVRDVNAYFVETSAFAWWWIAPGVGIIIIALLIYFRTIRRRGSSRK